MRDCRLQIACIFLFAAACLLPIACCAGEDTGSTQEEKTQKAKEYYSSGKLLLEQGNYEAANAQFKKAQGLLSQEPSAPATGRKALISPEPGQETSAARMAFAAAREGLAQEAITLYLQAIEASPKDANLYYNLGLEYLKTKRFNDAGQMFKRVIQFNPKDKDAHYNLAVLYESYLNDKRQALNYYAQYLKNAPLSANAVQIKEWMGKIKKELKAQ